MNNALLARFRKYLYKKLRGPLEGIAKQNYLNPIPTELIVGNVLDTESIVSNRAFESSPVLKNTPKKILCILPFTLSMEAGGYKTILRINDFLERKFNAQLYLCFYPFMDSNIQEKTWLAAYKKIFPLSAPEIIRSEKLKKLEVDVALCNFWMGAFLLASYNNCKRKFYLVQDLEANFYQGSISTITEYTLSLGFDFLTNSEAIKQYLLALYPKSKCYRYFPGVDHDIYKPRNNDKINNRIRVVAYARPSIPRNCFEILFLVFKNLKEKLGDRLEIFTVGEDFDVNDYGLNGIVTNLGCFKDIKKLAEFYTTCDIGISLISTPTFSYQNLEFMSSGLLLVTNDQPGIKDFLIDGYNAIVCPPIYEEIVKKIIEMASSPEEMKIISERGYLFAKRLNWNDCLEGVASYISGPL